ncbi:MAG TPA: hypothetical protein VMW27_21790 [Thermoanaerobaculia bacterium]|nr:hypothetical protein [Thermoanaerobaculia bacterium]
MRADRFIRLFALALGLSCVALPAAASRDTALGADGELYQVRTGTYGQLFPRGQEHERETPVLVLDVIQTDGTTVRHLVPETETEALENNPSLIYEEDSHTVFLLWESRFNYHPILMLTGFDGEDWSEAIEVIGNAFADKSSSSLTVTRDTYEVKDAEGNPVVKHRTVLHMLWEETNSVGLNETLYTPVILENGTFLGRSPIFKLNDFDRSPEPANAAEVPVELVRRPKIQPGRDGRTVVAVFASSTTRRLTALEIDVLPAQITQLADGARAYIIDLGARHNGNLRAIADDARAYIIDLGVAFQPEVARSIADSLHAYILSQGPVSGVPGVRSLADRARAYIIDLGARLTGRGLRNTTGTSTSPTETFDVKPTPLSGTSATTGQAQLIQIRVTSNRAVPRVGTGTDFHLFVSESGQDVLVAAASADRVQYRRSDGAGWKDLQEIRLRDGMDLNRALEILERQVRNH